MNKEIGFPNIEEQQCRELTQELLDELFKALGLSRDGWLANAFSPLFWKPLYRFSAIASRFDQIVTENGFQEAAKWILPNFVKEVNVLGAAELPKQGPLVVASNHPGSYDSLVISANLPRDDIKIVSSNIPFLKRLPATSKHMLFSAPDSYVRMGVLRQAIRHLRGGGALLVFARGRIDPDPAIMPGAGEELKKWSPSLGMFMKKAPQTKLAISLVSGILAPKFVHHPLTIFRKTRHDKQRIAEFLQGIRQMLAPGKVLLSPKLSFTPPLTLDDLSSNTDLRTLTDEIIQRAEELLPLHSGVLLPPSTFEIAHT